MSESPQGSLLNVTVGPQFESQAGLTQTPEPLIAVMTAPDVKPGLAHTHRKENIDV